jgi:hypothetical protein
MIVLLVGVVTACSFDAEIDSGAEVPNEDEPAKARLTLEELPPMPDYPNAARGNLTVVSSGDYVIDHEWDADVGSCEGAFVMELYAEDETSGSAIVLHYPDGEPTGVYPIVQSDSVTIDERIALVGVQVFEERQAFGFQAIEGTLEVLSLGEVISGRFASTIKEVQSEVLTRYVGTFRDVKIAELSADYCRGLRLEPEPPPAPRDRSARTLPADRTSC